MKTTAIFALALLSAASGFAGTIYNNTSTDTLITYFYSGNNATHIGDSITLAGIERTLTSASVQFYNAGSAANFTATLSFWQVGAPVGAQIGSSYVLNGLAIDANGISTVTFGNLNLAVPDNIVFAVSISNATAGSDIGLNAFEPPTVGASNNASLILGTTSGPATTFASAVTASGQGNLYLQLEAIPEPSTITLFGGAAVLAMVAARKRTVMRG